MRLRNAVPVALAVLALTSARVAAAQTPTPTPLPPFGSDVRPLLTPPQSAADPEGADAVVFNPAGLPFDDGGQIVYEHADRAKSGLAGDGDALYWQSSRWLSTGIEWARPVRNVSQTLFTFSTGIPMARDSFALGFGYVTTFGHAFGSPLSYDGWNAGAMWRPMRYASVGGTVFNAWTRSRPAGADLSARYDLGLALRPLPGVWNDRLTIAGDMLRTEGERHVGSRYTLRFAPVDGLELYASADDAKRYTGGLTVSFGHGRIGYHSFHEGSHAKWQGGATRVVMDERRQPAIFRPRPAFVKATVGGALPDASEGTLFTSPEETLPHLLRSLDELKRDPAVAGVIVHLKPFGGGMARAQEVRLALAGLHDAGKKVLCWVDNFDMRTYYVATGCDRIALHPAGSLMMDGLSHGAGYMKGTFDKLGVQFEYARVGEYKGAVEPLTRDEPSPEMNEVENQLLDAEFGMIVDGIAAARKLDPTQVKALIDTGFFSAPKAKEAKLVDYIAYPDDLKKEAEDYLGKSPATIADYDESRPARRGWGPDPEIGVIYATGDITEGGSRSTPLTGAQVLGADTLVKALRQAKDDGRIRAVVLRVDSPGGDGFASDQVWHEVLELKKKKPIVVSMGDVAASGGYYISMGANEIYADPGTITGSIGVFALRPNFQQLYAKIDYRKFSYSRGAMSELFDEARPMNDAEKQTLQSLIDTFYADFIVKAAQGRNTTSQAIDAIGRGHVWIGAKAREIKLVDSLGGLQAAVDRAQALAKLPASRRVRWTELPGDRGPFDGVTGGDDEARVTRAAIAALPFGDAISAIERLRAIGPAPSPWSPMPLWTGAADPGTRRIRRNNPWWPLPSPFPDPDR